MSNQLYSALNRNQGDIMSQFQNFVRQMQGINPQKEIDRMVQSGQVTQQQLNEAQRQAQQFMGMFKR